MSRERQTQSRLLRSLTGPSCSDVAGEQGQSSALQGRLYAFSPGLPRLLHWSGPVFLLFITPWFTTHAPGNVLATLWVRFYMKFICSTI